MFRDLLNKKNITAYRLSKESGVPYATISDLCCGKTKLEKCTAETVYRLAKALDMTMEEMLKRHMDACANDMCENDRRAAE